FTRWPPMNPPAPVTRVTPVTTGEYRVGLPPAARVGARPPRPPAPPRTCTGGGDPWRAHGRRVPGRPAVRTPRGSRRRARPDRSARPRAGGPAAWPAAAPRTARPPGRWAAARRPRAPP